MECKKFKGCKYFSYLSETNHCQLSKTCDKFSTNCNHCVSGEKTCPLCEEIGQCQTSTVLELSFPKDITGCHKVL